MRRIIIIFIAVLLFDISFSQEYIDYKVRTDGFYANTSTDFLSLADPTWHYGFNIGSSNSENYSWEYTFRHNQDVYGNGGWHRPGTKEIWSGTCLDNADNIYIKLEGWENKDSNWNHQYGDGDNDYSETIFTKNNINGNITRDKWFRFEVEAGAGTNNSNYKVEFDVWWDWSKPVDPGFSITNITTSSLTIELTDKKQYRITDWDYQVSSDASFSTIVASSTELVPLSTNVTSGLTAGTTYYIRIRGDNEAGNGDWTSSQTITTLGPTVSFTSSFQSSTDEMGTMILVAELSEVSGQNINVPFTINGSSTASGSGTDYSITTSPITINAGSTTGEITITIAEDALDEDNETIIVDMGTPINATQGSTIVHTATIADDDEAPTVNFDSVSQTSTNESGTMIITAELSTVSGKNITIPFTVGVSSTAMGNGTDYSISESPILINAGSTTGEITITISDDVIDEDDETVIVDMGTPINATRGTTTIHTATITDDDSSPLVTTTAAASVTSTLATLGGDVVDNGGTTVTERGVVYSTTNSTPEIGGADVILEANGDGAGAFSEAIGSLSPNTTYYFQAYAQNIAGIGYGGIESFTTKQSQTITFNPLPDKIYGDVDFASGATASSGLSIVYSTSDASVATIVGGQIHIVGSGSCTIYADQDGDATYHVAPQASQTLTVAPKTLIISAENKTKEYDGLVYSSFTVNYSGFVAGDDETDLEGTLAFSGTATTATNVGTGYVVTPGGLTSPNYDITFVNGTLGITKKELIVTADDKTKVYDGAVFSPFTVSYLGFENGENETALSGALAFSGSATTATNVGTGYVVTPEGLTSSNYDITFINGSLDITKKTLTVTAEDKTKEYDGSIYDPFTVNYSGFISDENDSDLGGTLSFSGTAVTATEVGTNYVISPSGLTSSNYDISFVNGYLDITAVGQTIDFDALAAKVYGDPPFNLNGTSSSGLPVSYTSSNTDVAVVSGNTITIMGVGTTNITASQSGNANFSAATDVVNQLTVSKADQILTLGSLPVDNLALKDFTDPIQVSASSSSGLPVTISLGAGSVATLNGSDQLESIGLTGNVIINIDQAGNTNYNSANASYTFNVVKSNQSIAFPEFDSQTYFPGLTIDLSSVATATSGLEVIYSVIDGSGTISGTVLTVTGAGIIQISASQKGNETYNPAPDVTRQLVINKANPVITNFEDLTKQYSDAPFTLDANSASSGLFSYSSSNSGVATIVGNLVKIVGSGTAELTASQSFDANYTSATATAILTVGLTDQLVIFDELDSKVVGDPDFILSATGGDSGNPIIFSSSDENVAICTGTNGEIVKIVGIGICNIYANQAGNSNYNVANQVSQILKINKYIAGDTDGDGTINSPEIAGDTDGNGTITSTEIAGDTDGDGAITSPEIAGDTDGDGAITSPEIAGDTDGDGTITSPEIAGDTDGDGTITSPEIAGDTDGDGTITSPEIAGDTDGDGTITSSEIAGDTDGNGTITSTEIAGDTDGDGTITSPEIVGDTDGDGAITSPEIAGDTDGDGTITSPEIAGDADGDGTITSPEIAGDTDGDGAITSTEIAGDTDGDGTINSPEIAGDTDGDGTINSPEIAGDTDGDGTITTPEIAGDTDGDGTITSPEIAGDTDSDGAITSPEIAGDTDGDGTITYPEIAGDTDGDGTITSTEIAGDTDGDGTITSTEIAGDTDGDGAITSPEISGDTDGDGTITTPEIAGDTDGDGAITSPEIAGDTDGDGAITSPEIAGDTDGDGTISSSEVAGDSDGDGVPDSQDDFPYDSTEDKDTDGDGIGDNKDTDDDGDGTPDVNDDFPYDSTEDKDSDGDGVGDNKDVYPDDPTKHSDNTAPVVNCRALAFYLNDPDTYILTEADIDYLAKGDEQVGYTHDDITPYEELGITVSKVSFSGDDIGQQVPVQINVTDSSGNISFCETTVQILENHAPEVIGTIDTIYVVKNTTISKKLSSELFNEKDGGQVLKYLLSIAETDTLPDWVSFEEDSLKMTISPTDSEIGEHRFSFKATDNLGKSAAIDLNIVVQIPTGVSEIKNSYSFDVYPNPSQGIIYIDFKGYLHSNAEISIQNINGQELYRRDYDFPPEPLEVDLSEYADGLYFIVLKKDKTRLVKKIILKKYL